MTAIVRKINGDLPWFAVLRRLLKRLAWLVQTEFLFGIFSV